jgi:hypothetical protein
MNQPQPVLAMHGKKLHNNGSLACNPGLIAALMFVKYWVSSMVCQKAFNEKSK